MVRKCNIKGAKRSLFSKKGKGMDFETFGSGCGLTALCGVLYNAIRIGQWQGKFENRVNNLEQMLSKQDEKKKKMSDSMNQINQNLAEIKTKLEYFIERQENGCKRHKK